MAAVSENKTYAPLTTTGIIIYGLPMIGGGAISFLIASYLMKYSTDALLIDSLAISSFLFISRIWDAVNDPLCGYLSDRTQSRFGKRKVWILSSSLPIAILFFLLWIPVFQVQEIFMGVTLILFFTAFTALYVPHYSLGAELSHDYKERNRIYGTRAIMENIGTFVGVAAVTLLPDTETARSNAPILMFGVAMITLVTIVVMSVFTHEEENKTSSISGPFTAFGGVLKNHYTRIVLTAGFFGQLGAYIILPFTLYFTEYVLNQPTQGNQIIAIFIISATIAIPVWIYLLNHFDKKHVWLTANLILAAIFGSTWLLGSESINLLKGLAAIGGIAAGAILFINPAALADTIDYGETQTGEKNQGAYFSVFTFVNKTAMALAFVIIGVILKAGGYEPNIPQNDTSLLFIRLTYSAGIALTFVAAAIALVYYKLDRTAHQQIRENLNR